MQKREQPGSTWIDVSKYLGSEYMLSQFPRLGDNDRFEVSGLPAESYQDWGKINEHARLQFPNVRAPPRARSNPPSKCQCVRIIKPQHPQPTSVRFNEVIGGTVPVCQLFTIPRKHLHALFCRWASNWTKIWIKVMNEGKNGGPEKSGP